MNGAASWLAAGAVAVLTHGAAVASLGTLRPATVSDAPQPLPAIRLAVNLVPPPVPESAPPPQTRVPQPTPDPAVAQLPAVTPQERPSPWPSVRERSSESPDSAFVLAAYQVVAPPLMRPRALAQPQPRYPLAARRKGWEGTVRCRVEVSAAGELIAIEVVETSGYKSLDRAAIRALEETPFASAEMAGRSVTGSLTVAVRFVLN